MRFERGRRNSVNILALAEKEKNGETKKSSSAFSAKNQYLKR